MIEALPEVATYGIDTATTLAAGPPADLPGAVPDFVGGILDAVGGFVNGSVDQLGETVSDIASGADPSGTTDAGSAGTAGETTQSPK